MTTLETISAHAKKAGLNFLLAGGHAVIAHGHARATFDLDLIVGRAEAERWKQLVLALGYEFYREGSAFAQFNPGGTQHQPLDLMLVNAETLAKLLADAAPAPPGLGDVKIVSLAHLLALKCHAVKHGHAARIVKDADDVIRLVMANRLNVEAPEWRELFLKHGTAELYEKVRRASI